MRVGLYGRTNGFHKCIVLIFSTSYEIDAFIGVRILEKELNLERYNMYLPYNERTPDTQYRDLLRLIIQSGREVRPIHGGTAKMVLGAQFHFNLKNGFPLLTERDLSKGFGGALGEHIAFLHGAQTIDELATYGCPRVFWERWVCDPKKSAGMGLPLGDLGPGSYGPAWTRFPTDDGRAYNQIREVVTLIKERPYLRTFLISPWIPYMIHNVSEWKRKVMVAPCHGWIHVLVFPETRELSIHHFQRSADLPVGVAFNLVQYAACGLMLAQVTGYHMRELVHTFSDVHVYESQYTYVEELLKREPRRFPTVRLDSSVTDLFEFRKKHFTVENYEPHPAMQIPTPV